MNAVPKTMPSLIAIIACALSIMPTCVQAESSMDCTGIAANVTAAITKEPTKVLMIIEDALVINENCVCEIIAAAISASKADQQLVTQIVQTAISVVPKQSATIMDCAKMASSGIVNSEVRAQVSGKESKNVTLESPEPETELESPEPNVPVRGVYLMQAPAGGFLPRTSDKDCISATQCNPVYP